MTQNILCGLMVVLCCLVAQGYAGAAEDESTAPAASMNEEVLSVLGDPESPAMLVVTVLKPNGVGPFPLVIMNHGSSGDWQHDKEFRYHHTYSAYYFLSRGYAVALPMMRGFGGSEGKQNLQKCNQEAVGHSNAKDIAAVISYMSAQPYIDGSRVVVAGQSLGGWNTLAYGAQHSPNIKGLINFAGGVIISSCSSTLSALTQGAAHYGAQTNIPSLWFYGDNDGKFPPEVWRAMYNSYTAAGGPAELVAYGRFMDDSHGMLGFPEGLRIWTPKVDDFLSKLGLPFKIAYPEYLPMDFPPATNFAEIDDVDAVPYLNDEGRRLYRKFLEEKMPKVFVISKTGLVASFQGGFDPLGGVLNMCNKNAQHCEVYAVDDYVAWVPPDKRTQSKYPPTHYAALADVDAVPYLKEDGKQTYRKYLTDPKPKVFVISAAGLAGSFNGGSDPLGRAMSDCQKRAQKCEVYAVDDAVVWRPAIIGGGS